MKIKDSLLMRITTVKRFWRGKIGWVTWSVNRA